MSTGLLIFNSAMLFDEAKLNYFKHLLLWVCSLCTDHIWFTVLGQKGGTKYTPNGDMNHQREQQALNPHET